MGGFRLQASGTYVQLMDAISHPTILSQTNFESMGSTKRKWDALAAEPCHGKLNTDVCFYFLLSFFL